MIYWLLAGLAGLWVMGKAAKKNGAGFITEESGGVVRLTPSKRAAVLDSMRARIATLQGAPMDGVPAEPGGRTVLLVDPPRPSSWDTMPAKDWIDLAVSQGFAVLMTFDGLLAAVQRSELPRWASVGGRWVVLVD